jgi:glycosyltransferase involved in cell wall biosynthesis
MSEPTMSEPTVSVIVPCYNYGHFLEGCLASVLSQEGVDVRVLVVDDLSTDDSAQVAERLAAREQRIELRLHRENVGLIPTANEGLEWAQGEYVVLLSADDQLVPGALRRACSVMGANPNVGMVYGRPLIAREGRPLPAPSGRWRATDVWSGAQWIRWRCRSAQSCISSPEVVVRNAVQRAVGGYDPGCFHSSDVNMWLRVAAVSDIAYVRGTPQAIYRVHASSMARSQESALVDLCERRAAYDSFFARCGDLLDDRERLRAAASRALARQALWRASRMVDRGVEDELFAGLTAFALDVHPDARRLREWRGLRLRQRIGAGRSLLFVPFLATGAAHRLQLHAARARWRLRGV